MAKWVKNPPAKQVTQVRSFSQEDCLEEDMAIHSSILACRILWTEEPGGLQPIGLQRVRHTTERLTSLHFSSLQGLQEDLVCLSTQQSVLGLVDC